MSLDCVIYRAFYSILFRGPFIPGHRVVQCYMLVSGPLASFTTTVITAVAVNMRPDNDAKRKFPTNLLPTTKKERHQCQERCGSTDRSRQTEQRRHRRRDHSVPREPPSSPRASASLHNHVTSHLSHLYNRRHLTCNIHVTSLKTRFPLFYWQKIQYFSRTFQSPMKNSPWAVRSLWMFKYKDQEAKLSLG